MGGSADCMLVVSSALECINSNIALVDCAHAVLGSVLPSLLAKEIKSASVLSSGRKDDGSRGASSMLI